MFSKAIRGLILSSKSFSQILERLSPTKVFFGVYYKGLNAFFNNVQANSVINFNAYKGLFLQSPMAQNSRFIHRGYVTNHRSHNKTIAELQVDFKQKYSQQESLIPVNHALNTLSFKQDNALVNWRDQSSSILNEEQSLFSSTEQVGYSYTHLNQANIMSSLDEIREIYQYIGTPDWQQKPLRTLGSLVVYTPARKAQHLIRALIATSFKFQNSQDFLAISEPLIKKIEPVILDQQQKFEHLKSLSHEKAIQAYADYQNGIISALTERVKDICDAINFKMNLIGDKLTTEKFAMLVIKILTDDLYRDTIKQELMELIEPYLLSLKNENTTLMELELHKPHEQYTQINIGAPATGKSYLMKKTLVYFDMLFSDFANISPDRFRLPLLQDPCLGTNRAIFGSLTQEETRTQFDEAVQCIQERYSTLNKKPHIFIERMNIGTEEIELAIHNGGKLRVSVTHYPIDKAISGNHERFVETKKRKVPIHTILNAFKSVSEYIPKVLKEYKNQDIVYYLYDMDRMISKNIDKPEALIARIDCKDQTLLVRNIEELILFQAKSLLNVQAQTPEQLYAHVNFELSHFINSYDGANILFVDPACNSLQAAVLHQEVYASYSKDKGFEIIDKQVLERVMYESTVAAELFTKLGLDNSCFTSWLKVV